MRQIQVEATPLTTLAPQHAQSEPSLMLPAAAAGRTMPSAERRAPSAEALTAPRAREQCCPPLPPDRLPPPPLFQLCLCRRLAGGSRAPACGAARPRPFRRGAGRRGAARARRRPCPARSGPGAELHPKLRRPLVRGRHGGEAPSNRDDLWIRIPGCRRYRCPVR